MPESPMTSTLPGAAGAVAARIAVLIPCYNEEVAIPGVVRAFRAALPDATIYVYDNNSRDRTRQAAAEAGAVVRGEPLQGKGNVVRRMFADIEADAYVLVDGDGTYEAAAAPAMVRMLLDEHLDMVTGVRVTPEAQAAAAYRPGHQFGNAVLTGMVRFVFGDRISDMLSGYRVFSRRFVKSFPALAEGFETETEFTVHALQLRMPVGEIRTAYGERPRGSTSKLNTWRDGFRILRTIINLVKGERPLAFFSACGAVLMLLAFGLFLPVLLEYLRTGLVPRLPTAVVSTGLGLAGLLAFACGLILDTVTRGRREAKRIAYLAIPGPGSAPGPGLPAPPAG
jgi:glycosyltransferase involved in cell wall biosynthesis